MSTSDTGGFGAGTGLLERAPELSVLSDSLAAVVASAHGRLVLVRGEAGVGKTALVRRCCDDQRSARVLWGACDALFTPRPLGPFLDIAQAAGGELERVAASGAPPYEVAGALMRELIGSPSSVVVVEDLHWADEATLDVLRIVARRVETLPALIVVTYRDDELDRRHPLRSLLGELMLGDRAARVVVEPLSPEAVTSLAAAHRVGVDICVDVDDLYSKTNGNPFFVTEALAAAGAEVPDTARDAVLARAARLSSGARELLEAIAVVPPHAELWLLEALTPYSAERLEECLVSGMLRAGPESVFFRHELARMAIEDSLPPGGRAALHGRVLGLLAQPPTGAPDMARLAHHAEAAGDVDAVLRFAPAAAERAASVGAHREAADQFARALRFSERLRPERRAELLEARARACYLTDQNPEAIVALRAALDCYREFNGAQGEGNALRTLSEYLWCPGRVAEATEAGRQSVLLLERLEPGRELGLAYAQMAALARGAANNEEAMLWATRTLESAERLDDIEILIPALMSLGALETVAGNPAGRVKLDQALQLAEQHNLVQPIGWVSEATGRVLLSCRSYTDANRYLTQALAYTSDHGLELYRHYALAGRARAALEQGHWDEAADFAEQVLRVRRASTTPTIAALVVVALLRARRGDPDPWSLLDEAHALAETSGELPRIGPVAAAKAEAAWLEGRLESVATLSQAALELALKRRAKALIGELASWRSRAGSRDDLPLEPGHPYTLQIAGEWKRAAKLWTQIGCPYESALALADADDESALRHALAELQHMGARPAAAIVAKRLRDRGVRGLPRGPRPATRQNPAGLTPRELEVLALVAQGLHNADIAERLFLSIKTVDHHVAAILRKLGVHTRAQATAETVRLGLTQPT
jgi:DNA-binding CsgD family transcriptional regulator